jgi:hypothetical protein
MNFKNVVNFLLILALAITPIVLAVFDKVAAASLSLISLSFALVFWNLDRFSEFKGGGFEAKLNTAVSDAYAAINEVKSLAISISSPVISLMAVKSSFQFSPLKYKLEYAEEIKSSLVDLKIDKEKIDEALSTLYDRVSEDHVKKIMWAINEQLNPDKKIFKSYEDIEPNCWPLDAIKRKSVELSINIEDKIEELIYFDKNKKLLNPDEWQG